MPDPFLETLLVLNVILASAILGVVAVALLAALQRWLIKHRR
uniref:Uncharacterized protein n=1 Tax=viral metagenome TaxID=1070528 RepID=A0A6M3JQH6_9ZZZZ